MENKSHPQVILKGRFQVVPRTIIFLFRENKVLLQKGAADKEIYPSLYNGIGGHIERGEDVLTAARRETLEETGLTCPDLHLAGTVMIDVEESQGILLFVFTGARTIGEIRDSREGILQWVEIDQLGNLPVVEDVFVLVTHVRQYERNRRLFFGKYLYDEKGKRCATFTESE